MRWLIIFLAAVVSISAFAVLKISQNSATENNVNNSGPISSLTGIRKATLAGLKQHANDIKTFTLKNNFNNRYCFLIDMNLASGCRRFFVYDLINDSIVQSGLVTHGSGIHHSTDNIVYSNEPGSNCTSPGKYRIGKPYYGKFGLAYKLYGMDKSNSNAFNRFVVLHAHPCVPDDEIAPLKICMSWGCPTVSPTFLNQLKMYISQSHKPILLWIFN